MELYSTDKEMVDWYAELQENSEKILRELE